MCIKDELDGFGSLNVVELESVFNSVIDIADFIHLDTSQEKKCLSFLLPLFYLVKQILIGDNYGKFINFHYLNKEVGYSYSKPQLV